METCQGIVDRSVCMPSVTGEKCVRVGSYCPGARRREELFGSFFIDLLPLKYRRRMQVEKGVFMTWAPLLRCVADSIEMAEVDYTVLASQCKAQWKKWACNAYAIMWHDSRMDRLKYGRSLVLSDRGVCKSS